MKAAYAIAIQAPATELAEFGGLYLRTSLRSLFYLRADCTRARRATHDCGMQLERYFGGGPNDSGRAAQSLRVRFTGLLSPRGFYGYQSRYPYEVGVRHVIFVNPARPCL